LNGAHPHFLFCGVRTSDISLHDLHTLDIGSNAVNAGGSKRIRGEKRMEEEENREDDLYDPLEDEEEEFDF
jgi:hypothetical protein